MTPTVQLHNGVEMPQVGYGVFQVGTEECERCVADALRTGYRLIDTAQAYQNEEGVGRAWRNSGLPREEVFLVSKIWISHYGYERARQSIDETLRRLQTDHLDLMLLHQPFCDYYGAYRALEEAYRSGKLRAIGVSNFYPDRFIDLASNVDVPPMVNQVETHVFNQQLAAEKYMQEFGCRLMSWGPLAEGKNGLFTNPTLAAIAARHGKTVAQVALRYLLQRDIVIIPKSVHVERMEENLHLFDFRLSADEMDAIRRLDTGKSLFLDHQSAEGAKLFMSWRNLS